MIKRLLVLATVGAVAAAVLVGAAGVQGATPIPVNVAEGQPVLQSSTAHDGFAYKAVDGNGYGVFGHGSVTHTDLDLEPWWEVDLGRSYELTEIVLWNRTDCCGDRLSNVHVFVSDAPFATSDVAGTAAAPGVSDFSLAAAGAESTAIDVGRSGRYVRVQLEGTQYLSLAEVEVFSLLDQSGQASDGAFDVDVFIDGQDASIAPGPRVEAGDHLLTLEVVNQSESEDFWAVYLWVAGIGRIDCPTRNLAPGERTLCEASVALAPGPLAARVEAATWNTDGARYDSTPTVYADVAADPAADDRVNLALGRPARQSERQPGHPASLAVDGNRDGDAANGSVAMTYRIVEAFWEVDLGEVAEIDEIVLWNRTDCCSERLHDFHVFVSDVPMELDDLQYTLTMPDIFDYHHRAVAGRRTAVEVGRTGRFVRIQAEYREAILQLAEVEVMGRTIAEPAAPPAPAAPRSPLVFEAGIDGAPADTAPGPELAPGSPFDFTYQVTNTGDETLWALYLWHDGIGGVGTCPTRRLDPGATVECRLAAVAEPGRYSVLVEASAWDGGGNQEVVLDAVNYAGTGDGGLQGPAVDLEVLVEGVEAAAPGPEIAAGSPVSFSYRVANVGTVRLWAPTIWHDGVGAVDCGVDGVAPGEEIICSASDIAEAGEQESSVYLSMWDDVGTRASDLGQAFYTGTTPIGGPALRVESLVAGEDADTAPGPLVIVGTPVTWSFTVTNVGSETIWSLWLRDPELDGIRCDDRTLDPGESVTCEIQAIPGVGVHSGEIEVKGWTGDGTEVSARDRHHYVVAEEGPGMEIEALVDGLDGWWENGPRIQQGEIATFSYLVTNTGSVPLEQVTVTDDRFGPVACPSDRVQPGITMTCLVRERMELGLYETYARVSALAAGTSLVDSERLAWHVKETGRNAQMALEVTINGSDASNPPGIVVPADQTVQIRYVITNLGTWTSMYSMEIHDPRVPSGQMSCPQMNEMYLGSIVCTATVTAPVGEVSSLVIARAWSANSPRMEATDAYHYYGAP